MAPTASDSSLELVKRYYCTYGYNCYSTWDSWGRWVFFGICVVFILFVAFFFSCINNRRRRRRGLNPMYGTGWMPYGGNKYNNQGPAPQTENTNYYQNQPYNGGAAPPYGGQQGPIGYQQTGNTFNSNEGYYGQQSGGIELQPPPGAYQPARGGDPVYEAPPYAPPGKGERGTPDAVIR